MKTPKDHKDEPVKFKFGLNEPTLFDLIDRHFPEPYRTDYLNPLNICKTLQAACRVEMQETCLGVNPAGSVSYWDRCKVHQVVSDLQQQNPEWRQHDFVNYLIENSKAHGLDMFTETTLKRWVSEIVKGKQGRPRKKTF